MKTGRLSSRRRSLIVAAALVVVAMSSWELKAGAEGTVYTMPVNCTELLPDNTPYLNFFEAVARGAATPKDRNFSKRLFRLLKLRDKIAESVDRSREQNPVDLAIRKTICFYREQKDPVRPVPFDDADFLKFMKGAVGDLETKIEDIVFQVEYEKFQRKEYELKAQRNREIIKQLENQADRDADRSFEKLSKAARRKVRIQE